MRKISNINSKKFTISLLCLLLIDDRWVRLAAEQSENEWSQIALNHDQSGKRSIPREPFPGIMIRDQKNLFQF
jgi:hypothetical protein